MPPLVIPDGYCSSAGTRRCIRDHAALAGLYLFAIGTGVGAFVAYLGLGIVVLAFLTSLPTVGRRISRDNMLWAFVLFTAYLAIRAYTAAQAIPALGTKQWASLWPWYGLWFFVPVGWMVARVRKHRPRLLLAGAMGFIAGLIMHTPWAHLAALLHGRRSGMGMSPTTAALFAGVVFLGWTGLAPRIWGARGARWYWPRAVGWLMVAIFLLESLIIAQSRAAWLSLGVILPIYLGIRYAPKWQRGGRRSSGFFRLGAVAAMVVVAVILAANWHTFSRRFDQEHRTVRDIAALQFDHLPQTSIGLRVYMVRLGIIRLRQRPLFGWGPGMEATQDMSTAPFPFLRGWSHLHNTYLETLVRLGLVGFAVCALCIVLFCRRVINAYRAGVIPRDILLFFVAAIVLVAAWDCIDFQALHTDYRFSSTLMLAIAYAYTLPGQEKN